MKTNVKITEKNERGITLIALIATIVIMLILAGISIKLAIDDNGVIGNAKEAKNQYDQSQADEDSNLNELSSEMKEYLNANKSSSSITKVDGVIIPTGFVYVGGTKDTGLVISDATIDKEKYKGQTTVGTDLQGNQFVWIPVDNIADYKRTNYQNNITFSNYSETLADDEKSSVEKYKGFYIGRYEAGDKESTETKTLRGSGASTSNTVVVKAKQAPYNLIEKNQAISLAENFGSNQGYSSVKSKLISSYAWDTAIAFIQNTNSDYGNNSVEGNYKDTSVTYKDIKDESKTKANGSSELIPTGQTTAVNNIYDMGGNVSEWTTETYYNLDFPDIARGGRYDVSVTGSSSGVRSYSAYSYDTIGFRIALFVN